MRGASVPRFDDRRAAGRELGRHLSALVGFQPDRTIVLALPRGGVAVGYEVARELGVPIDVIVARKIGAPHQPELAVGAVTAGGYLVIDRDLIQTLQVSEDFLREEQRRETEEARRREFLYRKGKP